MKYYNGLVVGGSGKFYAFDEKERPLWGFRVDRLTCMHVVERRGFERNETHRVAVKGSSLPTILNMLKTIIVVTAMVDAMLIYFGSIDVRKSSPSTNNASAQFLGAIPSRSTP